MEDELLSDIIDAVKPLLTQERRRALLHYAFSGERGEKVLDRIDFTGSNDTFAPSLVRQLLLFGEIEASQPALVVLLKSLAAGLGIDQRDRFDKLISRLIGWHEVNRSHSFPQFRDPEVRGTMSEDALFEILCNCVASQLDVIEVLLKLSHRDLLGRGEPVAQRATNIWRLVHAPGGPGVEALQRVLIRELNLPRLPSGRESKHGIQTSAKSSAESTSSRPDNDKPSDESLLSSMNDSTLAEFVRTVLGEDPEDIAAWAREPFSRAVLVQWATVHRRMHDLRCALGLPREQK